METVVRPYNSHLSPNERKEGLLKDTFAFLEHGSKVFFDTMIQLYGGIYPKIADNKVEDQALLCAINWFRAVEISKTIPAVPQPILPKLFTKYYGDQPSVAALEYLQANIDPTKYQWMDCRAAFNALQRKLGTTTLHEDLTCMIREKLLPVEIDSESNGWNSCSKLFGSSEKEDRTVKVEVLKKILVALEEKPPENSFQLKQLILEAANLKKSATCKDFRIAYAGNKGASCTLQIVLRNIEEGEQLSGEEFQKGLKGVLNHCKKKLLEKSNNIHLPNKLEFKKYMEREIGSNYDLRSWSQMFQNALSDILPKNTRNYNFANEKYDKRTNAESGLAALETPHTYALNTFFHSPSFTSDNEFVICPQHLGKLKKLYEIWNENQSSDDDTSDNLRDTGILEFCENNDLSQPPMKDVLKYIFLFRKTISAEDFIKAARWNQLNARLARYKVHPTVKGNLSYTFGESALKGHVVSPIQKLKYSTHKPDSSIWLTMFLLDNGEWKEHHVPFFNSRFYQDVYAYNPDMKDFVSIRTKRFGYNPATSHQKTEFGAALVRSARQKSKASSKAMKKIVRGDNIGAPNVTWNDPTFSVKRNNGKFFLSVNARLNKPNKNKFELKTGDLILGFDQNQTTAHTYAILKIVDANEAGAVPFQNYHVKPVETGRVTSTVVSAMDKVIDQLSYQGVEKDNPVSKTWRKSRRQYVRSLGLVYLKKYKNVNNAEKLYEFNKRYAGFLLDIMKGKFVEGQKPWLPPGIREEITELFSGHASIMRLSSLDHISFKALDGLKRLISSYFGRIIPDKDENTDAGKRLADPEMFEMLQKVYLKRNNKRKSKIDRSSDFLLTKAVEHNVAIVVGEKDLSTAQKGTKKSQNVSNMDWCARGLATKISQGLDLHNIKFSPCLPHYTSHQDPLVHKNTAAKLPAMRSRFNRDIPKKIIDWQMRLFSVYLKSKQTEGTMPLYRSAMDNFISHYGLEAYRERLTKKSITPWEFQKVLTEKLTQLGETHVIYPCKGGRYYLATHYVTTGAKLTTYDGRSCYLSDSDEIAAVNLGLTALMSSDKIKSSKVSKIDT